MIIEKSIHESYTSIVAVRCKCPECGATVSYEMPQDDVREVICAQCHTTSPASQTLCVVCDAPNPWRRRTSIHFGCMVCGTTQTWLSHVTA
jgi:hypothetical protein